MKRNRILKITHLALAVALVSGLLAPTAFQSAAPPAHLQAALAEAIQAAPAEMVRVIVQKTGHSHQPEAFVARLGGRVTKDLPLINGFAAEVPARAVERLARIASVNWVSLDAPVVFASDPTETVRDEFNTVSYSGNDGSLNWSTDWMEINESNGPASGDEQVVTDLGSKRLRVRDNDGGGEGVLRMVDLSTATNAILSLDYRRVGLDSSSDYVAVEISTDGGGTWIELDRFSGAGTDSTYQSWSADISAYLSSETTLRLISSSSLGGSDSVYFDNIQIEIGQGGTPPGDPPPGSATAAVRDEFTAVSYANNDGPLDWLGPWDENDYGEDSPTAGYIFIENNRLAFHYVYTGRSINRQADLSGSTHATLSFDWETVGLGSGENISILVSATGGGPFTELGMLSGSQTGHAEYDLSAYISPNTTIQFENRGYGWDYGDYAYFDNVQIELVGGNTYLATTGAGQLHAEGLTGQGVTVAVVDSGIGDHPDLAGRVIAAPLGAGDDYGHGTHVAGIIGGDGSASGGMYTGVAPGVDLISLQVSNANGEAYESDVVAALQWVFDNKAQYNIRVVNLSLNSTVEDTYHNSGMDAAAEILWLNGVVVVVSAGNFNSFWDWNTINAAPANDPFVIPVGASDEHGDADLANDHIALFSAWGFTVDSYFRPDMIAPGSNIISTLAPNSPWAGQYPERVVLGEYIRLSGTSMAAPVVTGAVALLLQAEPTLTPDQVKYRLMTCSNTIGIFHDYAYLDLEQATACGVMGSANEGVIPHMLLAKMAMIAYWASVNGGGEIDWENIDWEAVNWDAVDWDAVDWNAVNWNAVNWNAVNWNAVNWNAVNWNAVNWNAVNWNAVNWNSVLLPPGENAVNGGDGRSGVITQPEGLYWGDETGGDLPPTGCTDQIMTKGDPASEECPPSIWEKGNPASLFEPLETQ